MRQFFLPEDYRGTPELTLTGEEHHYLTRVLRYQPGKSFPGRGRDGSLYTLKILRVEPDSCHLSVAKTDEDSERGKAATEIIIYPAILKGKKFDQVIRQATETGVNRIQPIISRNTVVKIFAGEEEKKRERWEKIALEASQQCGNPAITEIMAPMDLKELRIPPEETGFFS